MSERDWSPVLRILSNLWEPNRLEQKPANRPTIPAGGKLAFSQILAAVDKTDETTSALVSTRTKAETHSGVSKIVRVDVESCGSLAAIGCGRVDALPINSCPVALGLFANCHPSRSQATDQ